MKLNIYKTPQETIEAMADYFVRTSADFIERTGRFTVALSGGSSPKQLFELLTTPDYRNQVAWQNIYFFFGDERYVPLTHKDSNYLMAKIALLDPLNIDPSHVFPFATALPVAEAAAHYEATLNEFFGGKKIVIDLILLGLGDNSHTASLFPHTNILHDNKPAVKGLFIDEINTNRLTLNAPLINDGHEIVFLVYGAGKGTAVKHIIRDEKNVDAYPAQLIQPTHGNLQWFIDEAAAREIV